MRALAVLLALGAGLSYASASVLQQRSAADEPPELSLSPRLIVALARRPRWLLGVGLDVLAYGLEAAALGVGSVVLVGPLLVSGLLFAVPLATVGTDERATRREMVPATMIVAGLAVFEVLGSPEGGDATASSLGWWLAGAAIGTAVGACVVAGRRAAGGRRAVLFGLGTGVLYGLTAVLTKVTVDLFDRGVLGAFGHWPPYALAVCSLFGLVLNQSAFQAGHVAASLPVIAVANPIVSCLLGVTILHESLGATSLPSIVATACAIVIMLVGTANLARSPLVKHGVERTPALTV